LPANVSEADRKACEEFAQVERDKAVEAWMDAPIGPSARYSHGYYLRWGWTLLIHPLGPLVVPLMYATLPRERSKVGDKAYTEAMAACIEPVTLALTLGPDHPNVAGSLHRRADRYYREGRYTEAEALYKRALAIRGKSLGPEHPSVAVTLTELARSYRNQRRYEEAEALYMRAFAIQQKALGPEHIDMARTLEEYASLLWQINRETEAAELGARAKAIRTKHDQQSQAGEKPGPAAREDEQRE